jgi:signal transduction histidine kinase
MRERTRARRLSLRLRVSLATMAAVAVVLAVAGVVLVRVVKDRQVSGVRDEAVRTLERTATQGPLGVQAGQFVSAVPGEPGVAELPAGGSVGSFDLMVPTQVVTGTSGVAVTQQVVGGVPSVVAYTSANTGPGSPVLVTVLSLDKALGVVRGLERALWIGIPTLVAAVGVLAWVLVGRALRPVDRIRSEVDEISHGTLHRRVPVPPTDDEVARLAETMNDMLDRLDEAAARQRRFVSDASHELRSPLATIRTTVDVASARPDDVDWPSVARTVTTEGERLGALIDDLLALARLDEGGAGVTEDVDLDELVLADVARLRAMDHEVGTSAVGAARLRGDRRLLERAVRNLLDNAASHARSRIEVAVRADGEVTLLVVDDDGPGIPPADREQVFERFARLDEGRARNDGGGGLGLALARAVAEHHGGSAIATASPLGGARIELRLGVRCAR